MAEGRLGGDDGSEEEVVAAGSAGALVDGGAVVLVVLLVLAVLGYFWGLGPMNRLNTARGITPPAKLGGLDRITDEEIRGQLQLDQTREALSQINDGKQARSRRTGTSRATACTW